jgi:murein DD-endopeptidase MepM/ murein hydrolase activator NlpD
MHHRRLSMVMALAAVIGLSGVFAGPAAAAEDAVYYLPVAEGSSLIVQQGNNRTAGRTADERYAFDFVATDPPERFEVVAARGGTVISARTGVAAGKCAEPLDGPRPSCWRTVNYVLIDHGDGTSGLYLNLKRGDAPFRIGDVVSAGQPIGTAGRSGWTDKVGLGFQVQGTPTWDVRGKGGWFLTPSLPVSFSDPEVLAVRANGIPRTGDTVTSGNPEASFSPFRFHTRPVGLPASVPFETGIEREITDA